MIELLKKWWQYLQNPLKHSDFWTDFWDDLTRDMQGEYWRSPWRLMQSAETHQRYLDEYKDWQVYEVYALFCDEEKYIAFLCATYCDEEKNILDVND